MGSRMGQSSAKSQEEAAGVLAYPLSRIINVTVKLSIFTEESETAKLKLLFKKGLSLSKTDLKKCRLVSLLPLVSKSIEKSMHYQLQGYPKA